jgi:hypothetical protein
MAIGPGLVSVLIVLMVAAVVGVAAYYGSKKGAQKKAQLARQQARPRQGYQAPPLGSARLDQLMSLLDKGAITQTEFDSLKAKTLA